MNEIEKRRTIGLRSEWAFHHLRSSILRTLKDPGIPLSFKELTIRTGIRPSLCAYHLKFLDDRGMVVRSFSHERGRKDYSYYAMTAKGADALRLEEALSRGNEPPPIPSAINLIAWRNMPRCFILRRA